MDDEARRLVDDGQALVDVDEPRRGAHAAGCGSADGAQRGERDHDHAEGDRDVGEVERRPQRRVEEVGDGAVADPVGKVAERPPAQQADAEPQQRPRGVEREPAERSGRARRP